MKTLRSTIQSYLLKIDFSKKVIFVIATSILIALFLLLNILLTYSGLTTLLQKQLAGLKYHQRVMVIYEIANRYQAALDILSADDEANIVARVSSLEPQFSYFSNDLKNHISSYNYHHEGYYLNLITELSKEIQKNMLAIHQHQINRTFSKEELRNTLKQLKENLFSFLNMICFLFDLNLHIDYSIGLQLKLLTQQLPAYQNALSQLLAQNLNSFSLENQGEMSSNQIRMEENLKALLKVHQLDLKKNKYERMDLAAFLATAIKFSNSLSSHFDETVKSNLMEQGIQTLRKSAGLYTLFSKDLKKDLRKQLHIYYCRELISIGLFFLGIFLILTPYLAQAFRRPLGALKIATEKLTGGDLSVRIPIIHPDEVGAVSQSFNETAEMFEQFMNSTSYLGKNLSKYASEIFISAKKLEESLNVQEKTVSTITQNSKNIHQTVQDFSIQLVHVNNTIRNTANEITLNQLSLNELEEIMKKMSSSAENTVAALSSIKSEIDKIKGLIQTLVNIADQVNLLSINTAVRASKTIKTLGYTVIADKIRELADKTAYVALDMEQVVHQTLEFVPEIMFGIDQFTQEIQEALEDAIKVREQFQQWLTITQIQIKSFQNIDKGMRDQEHETMDIDQTIKDLANSTHKAKRSVQNLTTEIEYLQHSTKSLLGMTKKFVDHANKR